MNECPECDETFTDAMPSYECLGALYCPFCQSEIGEWTPYSEERLEERKI